MDPNECLRLCLELCKDLIFDGKYSFAYSFKLMSDSFCESGFDVGSFELMMMVAVGYVGMSEEELLLEGRDSDRLLELCERFIDLGEWIECGGFLPKLWDKG
jgi:hypothetical protein